MKKLVAALIAVAASAMFAAQAFDALAAAGIVRESEGRPAQDGREAPGDQDGGGLGGFAPGDPGDGDGGGDGDGDGDGDGGDDGRG